MEAAPAEDFRNEKGKSKNEKSGGRMKNFLIGIAVIVIIASHFVGKFIIGRI